MATKAEAPKFKKIRSLTLPLLKIEKNTERFFYFHGPMYLGDKVDPKKDPATLAHVVDLETGEEGLIICPSVMQSELRRHYGNDGYMHKCFGVRIHRIPEKNYNIVTLDEVGEPDDLVKLTTPPQAGAPGAIQASIDAAKRPDAEDDEDDDAAPAAASKPAPKRK